ncbi:MAG: hypothetical protein EA366_03005 [Spirulina sp. DLM2.Bin59]|nr:MAG: hypothetical protein EA366_03005 [Spirulina sp. DLM2.Bin59]
MRSPLFILMTLVLLSPPGIALPPPEDVPEEVLRTEITLEGRSPTGATMTASEYAELTTAQAESPYAPVLDSEIRQVIFLLQIRRMLKPILPFIP